MNEIINDGGPAFPAIVPPQMEGVTINVDAGMSLRDWFAGQALAGLEANPIRKATIADDVAIAYQIADAMLIVRKAKL